MFARIFKFLKTLTMFAKFLKILRNVDYVCRVSEKFGTKTHNEKKSEITSRTRVHLIDFFLPLLQIALPCMGIDQTLGLPSGSCNKNSSRFSSTRIFCWIVFPLISILITPASMSNLIHKFENSKFEKTRFTLAHSHFPTYRQSRKVPHVSHEKSILYFQNEKNILDQNPTAKPISPQIDYCSFYTPPHPISWFRKSKNFLNFKKWICFLFFIFLDFILKWIIYCWLSDESIISYRSGAVFEYFSYFVMVVFLNLKNPLMVETHSRNVSCIYDFNNLRL